VRFPIPSYEGEELEKVREWEKTWAGKEVDYTNVDQVADMLPKGWVRVYKNPEEWHYKRFWFTIVPYQQIVLSKGFIEATKRHALLAREKGFAGKDNDELVTYSTQAGFPFPDPQTGLEVAYNLHFQNCGESEESHMTGGVTNCRTGVHRPAEKDDWILHFAARTDRDPKPMFPKKQNRRNIRKASLRHFFDPPELADQRFLVIRYNDLESHDDSYMWLPQFRRIRRYVATQKMDTMDGGDHALEDGHDYNNHIPTQTYKLLGRKDMLVGRHEDITKWTRQKGEAWYSGVQRERVKTYVVEAISKDENHIYSKRIWYVDPEFFLIAWSEKYDELGRYWRVHEYKHTVETTVNGEPGIFMCGDSACSQQRVHGNDGKHRLKKMGDAIDPKLFTLVGIRKFGY
jgi:hypothetical protein